MCVYIYIVLDKNIYIVLDKNMNSDFDYSEGKWA